MITLNNDINNNIDTPITVNELVKLLNLQSQNIAIAVNEQVIRRSEWETMKIKNNDSVDIVRAVGGG